MYGQHGAIGKYIMDNAEQLNHPVMYKYEKVKLLNNVMIPNILNSLQITNHLKTLYNVKMNSSMPTLKT